MSNYSMNLVVPTMESPLSAEELPVIQRAHYTIDSRRIRFQLSPIPSSFVFKDQLCLQYYHMPSSVVETNEELPTCTPLKSLSSTNNEFEIASDDLANVRLKLCLMNQTDVCSRATSIPTGLPLSSDSSEFVLIIIGKRIAGGCASG